MLKPVDNNADTEPRQAYLERVARNLADAHSPANLAPARSRQRLPTGSLDTQFEKIFDFLGGLDPSALEKLPGVEWLLDNDYVVQEAIAIVKASIPQDGYRRLPALATAPRRGELRVLVLADEIMNACGTPMELSWVERFLVAYQKDAELCLGELWALPNMLRSVALQRLAKATQSLLAAASDNAAAVPDYSEALASYVINLRSLATQEWTVFVERVSRVHEILQHDPIGAYAHMDAATCNRYRYQVEVIARRTGCSESIVARRAVALAKDVRADAPERERHVGFYLIEGGLGLLVASLQRGRRWTVALPAWLQRHMPWWYLGSVVTLATFMTWWVSRFLPPAAMASALLLPVLAVLSLTVGVSFVHWLVGLCCKPQTLLKMDFSTAIPVAYATAVVTPAMLSSRSEIEQLIQCMEQNYLGNPDPALRYALLTDFLDANSLHADGDEALLRCAVEAVESLNARYGTERARPFFLFHRQRQWNGREGCYMAYERKRGKLGEFNRLLLGSRAAESAVLAGDTERLRGIRFVITLDADTQLPPGSANTLVGVLAHPLNAPVLDGARVTAGYSMIQPRLCVYPETANSNRFTRAFAGDVVLDLYSHAVSNVYQDLFGVGIFAGKGIYDVRAFEQTLKGRVPDNAILSHDLFEGLHGRVGLATDIVLFEDYPVNLLVFARRAHRWIRGDWQLLPWLAPYVPAEQGFVRNRFTLLDRWKLFDNLRRSLVAPATLFAFIAAWTLLPDKPWLWTLGILTVSVMPIAFGSVHAISSSIAQGGTPRALVEQLAAAVPREDTRWLLSLAYLPYESFISLDAIVRTLWRLAVSRRHLLQWHSAAQVVRDVAARLSRRYVWRRMLAAPLTALATGGWVVWVQPTALWLAMPFLILWLAAPQISIASSRRDTPAADEAALDAADKRLLRRVALRTWLFFEHFVGPDTHWLPPDNYHEAPENFVSKRTSPTNIGLLLLATVAAYDLGYLGLTTLIPRLRYTFESMRRLHRYRGHFLNWYRLDDLTPLEPRYVSAVDSGNLAASLITLKSALCEIDHAPLPQAALVEGTLDILRELRATQTGDSASAPLLARIEALIDRVSATDLESGQFSSIIEIEQTELKALQSLVLQAVTAQGDYIASEDVEALRRGINLLHGQIESCRHQSAELVPYQMWAASLGDGVSKDIDAAYRSIRGELLALPDFASIPAAATTAGSVLLRLQERIAAESSANAAALTARLDTLREQLRLSSDRAQALASEIQQLVHETDALLSAMDFAFLYDPVRHLLRLGYTVTTGAYDANHYDLLASEARLASFVAIAKGDVPPQHWLYLGRPFTRVGNQRVLASWSATAFEYLMPHLLMRAPPQSLLAQSCRVAVKQQRIFSARLDVPWGVSESAFYQLDTQAHYQYRAFGVPGLGLRRENRFRLVIAPYASALALPFAAKSVISNLRLLDRLKMFGRFGYFEAVDFGFSDAKGPHRPSIVFSYMSHHQGMILTALNNALNDGAMVRRFHADPNVASHVNLLYEQVPRGNAAPIGWRNGRAGDRAAALPRRLENWNVSGRTELPQLNVLSNGHYQVLLNHFGISTSSFDGLCLTRWQSDPCDPSGTCFYFKDLDSGVLWSAGTRPIGVANPNDCDASFSPHMAEFHRRDHGIHSRVQVVVVANDDVEIRRVSLNNDTDLTKRLEVISYAEPVLTQLEHHERHPVFSKLFIETSVVQPNGILLARRRSRDANESPIYLAHGGYEFGQRRQQRTLCLDRREFLGRWGSVRAPAWLAAPADPREVSNNSFDPVLALGIEVELRPRAMTELVFVYAAGRSRAEVAQQVAAYQSRTRVDWAFHQARLGAEHLLAEIGIEPSEVAGMLALLSGVYGLEPHLRAGAEDLADAQGVQSTLWSRGISGDLPILLFQARGLDDVAAVERLVRTHVYWDRHQIAVDLVIFDDERGGYAQPLRSRLARVVEESRSRWRHYTQGKVYIVPIAELSNDDRRRMLAAAWMVLDPLRGSPAEQLASIGRRRFEPPFVPLPSSPISLESTPQLERPDDLRFDNGLGGFSPDGAEYVVFLRSGQTTPAPWSNVIANPNFGFLITESGASTTWAENSGENRLTPWCNDPVGDPSGEALFLRDEETGAVWSPTPRPAPDQHAYEIRHGAGYTTFEHISQGLRQTLQVYADTTDPVKICRLNLSNCWQRPRRITVTYYAEWVLGVQGGHQRPYIVSELDPDDSVLYARNAFAHAGTRTAFLTSSLDLHGVTTDRREFLGLDGDPTQPSAMRRIGLTGVVIPGEDPCAVLQVHVNIAPAATVELHFVLGQGQDRRHAQDLVRRYRNSTEANASLVRVNAYWGDVLGGLTVTTPDPGLNLMANRWLLYQALSCRLWGRTALYQSGGGFGFRDQLQDVMAFTVLQPQLARAEIVRAAGVQFYRGDVLHWWHEDPLRGVRTRCSDDMLWLPYVTAHYVVTSGDASILDERVAYLEGMELAPDEGERYAEFRSTHIEDSVYAHCLQAIELAAGKTGSHGLPLIGSGDWNDGLNRVGVQGRGESVWLGWFLTVVYRDFAALCDRVGDTDTGADYRARANALVEQVAAVAWDGAWYLRAYDDAGRPLGSAANDECRIELNAQTWSVLADAPDESHRLQAMRAAKRQLLGAGQILRLLTPPFERGDSDPGYIKGYPPGVRENGAQYSHAAVWAGFAYGKLGDGAGVLEIARCLNPISHSDSPEAVAKYRVEPYVVAADIYSEPPNVGRGGWTWYTGAAAWTYRLIVEVMLGIRRHGDGFEIRPCLPSEWQGYQARLRFDDAEHEIRVVHEGAQHYRVYVDDVLLSDGGWKIATQNRQQFDGFTDALD